MTDSHDSWLFSPVSVRLGRIFPIVAILSQETRWTTYSLSSSSSSWSYTFSGADSMGHGGHVPPLLQMAGHGGAPWVRRTTNKKLTKLYWPSRKRSPKRPIVLLKPKTWRARPKQFSRSGALSQFQIRSGATVHFIQTQLSSQLSITLHTTIKSRKERLKCKKKTGECIDKTLCD